MSSTAQAPSKPSFLDRFLGGFEKVANKLPSPFMMFIGLFCIMAVLSLIFSMMGVTANNPADGELITVNNFFSRSGIDWFLRNLVKNFTGYAPLGLVLTMNFGIGMCEEVGLVRSLMKKGMSKVPPALLTYAICWLGCMGNLASDAAQVVIPPLAAMLFLGAGRNPVLGFMCARGASSMGFHANMLLAGTDALAQGITNSSMLIATNNPALQVDITCNYFFMFTATIVNTIVCGLVTDKIIAPRIGEYHGKAVFSDEPLDAAANKGLKWAGIGSGIYFLAVMAGVLPKNGILRTADGAIQGSPFLKGMIPLLFGLFLTAGICYGIGSGFITKEKQVSKIMSKRTGHFNGYIVQVFAVAQFVAIFKWTQLGNIAAIGGANLLKSSGFTGLPLILSFVCLTAIVGFFITSNSACWSLLAPIFVPMFMYMGFQPAFTQLSFRVGRSILSAINPLSVYLYMILNMINTDYDEDFTLGKCLSLGVPYVVASFFVWVGMLVIVYLFNLPIGPGAGVYLAEGVQLMI